MVLEYYNVEYKRAVTMWTIIEPEYVDDMRISTW